MMKQTFKTIILFNSSKKSINFAKNIKENQKNQEDTLQCALTLYIESVIEKFKSKIQKFKHHLNFKDRTI